ITEGKCVFYQDSVSIQAKIVNENRFQIHAMVYNLFNWFRGLVLPNSMRTQQIDTIRLKLLKVAGRSIRSARYNVFKLCSSFPYRKEFLETLQNIRSLQPLLE
ncbi:MAG: transposase, partial [Oscillospiraceae bacterium]|nr:transposase [Oscillospiraceae bacterium]